MKQRLMACLLLIMIMLLAYFRPYYAAWRATPSPQIPSGTMLSGEAMTLEYHITFGKSLNATEQTDAEKIVFATFDQIHRICNQWNQDSLLSRCNQMAAGQRQAIPPLLQQLLVIAHDVHVLSQGRYDPTIEPLKKVWMEALHKGEEPSNAFLAHIAPQIGWHQLHVENGYLWKDHDKLALNLDSIAKGYCVDLLTERLVAAGFSDVFVEWGGEIRAAGQHFQQRPWQLFIRRLEDADPKHALATLTLQDAAVATSGDYLQHWTREIDHKITYFHIFDPHTLHPLSTHPGSIASVTVRAPTCALADALATAGMFCSNLDEARQWAHAVQQKFPDTAFWFAARGQGKEEF